MLHRTLLIHASPRPHPRLAIRVNGRAERVERWMLVGTTGRAALTEPVPGFLGRAGRLTLQMASGIAWNSNGRSVWAMLSVQSARIPLWLNGHRVWARLAGSGLADPGSPSITVTGLTTQFLRSSRGLVPWAPSTWPLHLDTAAVQFPLHGPRADAPCQFWLEASGSLYACALAAAFVTGIWCVWGGKRRAFRAAPAVGSDGSP